MSSHSNAKPYGAQFHRGTTSIHKKAVANSNNNNYLEDDGFNHLDQANSNLNHDNEHAEEDIDGDELVIKSPKPQKQQESLDNNFKQLKKKIQSKNTSQIQSQAQMQQAEPKTIAQLKG